MVALAQKSITNNYVLTIFSIIASWITWVFKWDSYLNFTVFRVHTLGSRFEIGHRFPFSQTRSATLFFCKFLEEFKLFFDRAVS